ncbi:MAG: Asparagine synthetase [glutamine-hydrolyzing] 1 [Alphaproteobacteria bacterium MarineAlpha3_Bin5]|nr:asparagine synthase (glutamine-hydrolyzing) [Magnetovibrio sp.]PPR76784.1 MAG: Asparagine synthetase [glutamine-hydrolyzing] 1 [Alphaproteobacteria bacterium MarineAlpha3_Bin5]
MCGIAGIMTVDGNSPPEDILTKMSRALVHRGPDGTGHFNVDNIGVVHRRLAIIDIHGGDQPLFSNETKLKGASKKVVLVANGEIYNHLELREKLGSHLFSTKSDCEAALRLYTKKGLDMNEDLRGMYALAIYDPRDKKLVLMRDPFGIKPLYYCENNLGFLFSSEPKAFIAAGAVIPSVDTSVRDEFTQLQFTSGRKTIYKTIRRLLPGEIIIVKGGHIIKKIRPHVLSVQRYFSGTIQDGLERLEKILTETVDIHQRSDVPYGMFFSGGIDSSALLTMMSRLNSKPVEALTIGFSGTAAHDEREFARTLANQLGANHSEVEFSSTDFWKLLPEVISFMDEPVADYAILPTYKLAAEARRMGLKVILSGEGGDEIFAGYGRYRRAVRPRILGGRSMRFKGIFEGLGILREFPKGWRDNLAAIEQKKYQMEGTALQKIQAVDIESWLPNDLLTKLDRCLMAHSIEGRVPFLDLKLARFAFQLPDNYKIKGRQGKWLLRRWLERALPESQPFSRKRGFQVPVAEWIKHQGHRLGPLVAKQPGIVDLCQPDKISTLFSSSGKSIGEAQWILLFYALWHQQHILGKGADGNVFDVLSSK